MAEIDRRGLYRADGYASAAVMVRHVGRLAPGEASGLQKSARMVADLDEVGAAYRAGDLGTDQVRLLGRVHGNRRVQDLMGDQQGQFIADGRALSYKDYEVKVRGWERLMDQDGPEPANSRNHERRDFKLVQDSVDLGWNVDGGFGALHGAAISEIFAHYVDAERRVDWEKARAEHGDAATDAHLARTEAQRRGDAQAQIFEDAAGSDKGPVPVGFMHLIVWSADTFQEMLGRLDGEDPRPFDVDAYRCETLDGTPLEPTEAAATSLWSAARRVIIDAKGEVIDQGRARCFTGPGRLAVKLTATTCVWPGCGVPVSRCETDHLVAHADGGPTNPTNGCPLCGKHNRWKQKGFTIWRDPTGDWHTTRPDGTQIPP